MLIGIIGAMDQEIALLKNEMDIHSEQVIANCLFIKGRLKSKDIVLLKSGIGKVNAAMATTILVERFQPDLIINTGSAGGLDPELDVGDIVIGEQVVHHDVDVTAFDYKYGQVPSMPEHYTADLNLILAVEKANKKLSKVKSKRGLIATGDSFMQDPERVAYVQRQIPNIIAVEMEAVAIGQVCYQYDLPFVVIRALSDIAGKESAISFDEFLDQAATHAAKLIMEVLSVYH
ncbi:5'-methylthioadenosine/S-adenosylhomocysteine nucleosidase [Amphibacillus cookii]|uniref:5'-methylthioadenosine/S-adenosylhomocysteine nucleosidase n=1 Tax=Amphibacillus cookii TaxID=767787 RepID=UPI00195732C5|nr:5'-methylthioadenosine/S-adenosylhomocysteine nucleosidase [Amphibacillus cookii]MBM7541707.1 adenosylhomocysteine nucleosidase [Amphibacillus cookii]